MNLNKSLASIIITSILVTGCNINNIKKEDSVADKATQQKTMTKVQNDVNEIMNKDYDYVLKNMGTPYSTTYFIDIEKIKDAKHVEDLNYIADIRLVYPKDTSDNKLEKSALYIEINNNNVTEVQTYDFSDYDIKSEVSSDNVDIIIDKYHEKVNIDLKDIQNIDFNKYLDDSLDKVEELVNFKTPNFEAYDKVRGEKFIKIYILKDGNKNNKLLAIFADDSKVKKIQIIDSDKAINIVQSYIIK